MTKGPLVEFCADGIVVWRLITKHRDEITFTFPRGLALDRAHKTSGFLPPPTDPYAPATIDLRPTTPTRLSHPDHRTIFPASLKPRDCLSRKARLAKSRLETPPLPASCPPNQ